MVDKAICVSTIVQEFTATILEYDCTQQYTEFKTTISSIRIIIATILLNMGINVPDIKYVIVWKIFITESLANIQQQIS